MRRPPTAAVAVAIVLFFIPITPAAAADGAAGTVSPGVVERIVNGNVTASFPTTGALLTPSDPATAGSECSGTLVGCQTFVTAGHCVCPVGKDTAASCLPAVEKPSSFVVYLQHAGFFAVSSIALNPDFNFEAGAGDVAVLKLATPVNGIRPTPLNTTAAPALGMAGTIVGFGRSGGFSQDYGIKRAGSVTTTACNGVSGSTSVCWKFSGPLGIPGTNSNTCNGDSGGPLFIDFGAGLRLAGTTSGGTADDCLPTDNSFDSNVFVYRSWIQQQAGEPLDGTPCGSLPQVGETGTNVLAFAGDLNPTLSTATPSFVVPPGSSLLRVTMNGVDDGSDFDLFVKAGSPPSQSNFDCSQDGPGQFASCEFSTPAAGTWYALVNRSRGSGTYQLTATTFGGGCSDPASAGQSCDDNNPCTVSDRCQSGVCRGTAATNGTPCDDGNPCTAPDSCQDGACTGNQGPRTDCHAPFVTPSGLFRLQDTLPGQANTTDKLTWNWLRGNATQVEEFGDPLSSTNYDLCVFDQSAGSPTLVMSEHVAAGARCGSRACWKKTASSFRYSDSKLRNGPITSLYLRKGADGKAKITMKGKGTMLGMPSLPLHEQNAVTVQLSNGAACWGADYSDSTQNNLLEFKAVAH